VSGKNIKEILPHKRFSPRDGDKIDAHLFGFLKKVMDEGCLQFLPLVIIPGITAITIQVTTHGWADHQKERRMESISGFKLVPFGGGGDELVDDEVFSKLGQAFPGTPTDGPLDVEKKAFKEISAFRIIGNRIQAFLNQGESQEPLLADAG
jgi:hypothetical protein